MIWASAEVGVALMVSSSPLLRPVFDRIFGRFISTLRSSAGRTDPNSKYHNNGKGGEIGPRTLISAAKHPSRGTNGFMEMSDFDENLEMGDIQHRVKDQIREGITGRRPRSNFGLTSVDGEHVGRDDASTDKIFVRTEIIQNAS